MKRFIFICIFLFMSLVSFSQINFTHKYHLNGNDSIVKIENIPSSILLEDSEITINEFGNEKTYYIINENINKNELIISKTVIGNLDTLKTREIKYIGVVENNYDNFIDEFIDKCINVTNTSPSTITIDELFRKFKKIQNMYYNNIIQVNMIVITYKDDSPDFDKVLIKITNGYKVLYE